MGPTRAYIDHANLRHNIGLIRQAVGKRRIMAVVKADGYGHGSVEVARTALKAGCEYLAVAFVEEGITLREAGIRAPVLVFGAHHGDLLRQALDYQLEITITDFEQVRFLEKNYPGTDKIPVHVKIDTGMNRAGFPLAEMDAVIDWMARAERFEFRGVYSHFSTSDEEDSEYAELQLSRLHECEQKIRHVVKPEPLFHMANSAAIMTMPQAYFDMVRPGIMLYGQPPGPDFPLKWDLREVMSLRSELTLIKKLERGEPVSYNRRYYTEEASDIGVIPVGYADGFRRGLTNNFTVLINGRRYPLVGTVCMDMSMVLLAKNHGCAIGDEVVLYGGSGNEHNSVREVAARLGTIPYEVTCNVSKRVPRIHVNEN